MAEKKLTLSLDFHSGLPIYTQIVNQIQSQLVNGILKPAVQPPTSALASELRVNFNTVARAYRILDEARIISTQQGRGTYITEIPPPEIKEKLRQESLAASHKDSSRSSVGLLGAGGQPDGERQFEVRKRND